MILVTLKAFMYNALSVTVISVVYKELFECCIPSPNLKLQGKIGLQDILLKGN